MIGWLQQNGDQDNELMPGEVKSMVNDFSKLTGQEFPTGAPDKAYEMARG